MPPKTHVRSFTQQNSSCSFRVRVTSKEMVMSAHISAENSKIVIQSPGREVSTHRVLSIGRSERLRKMCGMIGWVLSCRFSGSFSCVFLILLPCSKGRAGNTKLQRTKKPTLRCLVEGQKNGSLAIELVTEIGASRFFLTAQPLRVQVHCVPIRASVRSLISKPLSKSICSRFTSGHSVHCYT